MKLKPLFIGLGMALIFSLFYFFDTFYNIESNLLDRLTTEKRAVDQRIKILAIDEESLQEIGKWPWPRDILAKVAEQIASSGARGVWTDVLYTEKSQNAGEDRVWEKVVQEQKSVYSSMYVEFPSRQKNENELSINVEKWPAFQAPREQVGHINILEDPDRVIRKAILGIPGKDNQIIPSIDVRLVNRLLPLEEQIVYKGQWYRGKQEIPTNQRNEVYFSYAAAPQERFETIPVSWVINGKVKPEYFKDALVLIGPYTIGLQDVYETPMSKTLRMYGVEIHANILQSLLEDTLYVRAGKTLGISLTVLWILMATMLFDRYRARRGALLFVGLLILYTAAIPIAFKVRNILLPYVYPMLGTMVAYGVSIVTQYLRERKERNRVTGIFGRYVSKAVVNEILASKEDVKVGGVRKDVTLMFVDIRGFTTMSEKMEPEDVIQVLNEYLDLATRAVFAYEGTLDKFIGDGVMSIFGAPIEQANHAERAVRAALIMKDEAQQLSERLMEQYGRTVRFGIGINSGPAVIGNIGSQERLDYTAIGDTVNLAARLESNAKPGQILISKETYERVKELFIVNPLEAIKVKGKEKPVEIFEVFGDKNERMGRDK